MITLEVLKKLGITQANLKKKFTSKKPSDKIKELVQLMRDRIDEGRRQNLVDYKLWWAMDVAYDVPFRQTTYSMLWSLMDRLSKNEIASDKVKETFESWGLSQFIKEEKNNGKTCHVVDLPVMFKIHIPLVRAYLNIRWAKLYSDRNVFPFLKYEPIKYTTENRMRCEIITDTIEMMGQQMGYRSTFKQWLFNMLHYGTAIMFPSEDWYREKCPYLDPEGKIYYKTKKQGLRYNIPHPSRVFYDQAHRVGTINYDNGVSFAGYWRIARYREVMKSQVFWNKEQVSMMDHDLIANNAVFFSTVYPCQMEFPNAANSRISGAGMLDRESNVSYYTSAHEDKACVLTDLFMKLVPSEWDLGECDEPFWFRFVLANDDDVLYCAPLCYTAPVYMGYDAHEERRRNASLSLEVLPFQDHMSNLVTQQILTIKQNLAHVIFVNTDLVKENYIRKIENKGEDLYRTITFIPYEGRKVMMGQNDIRQAFTDIKFQPVNSAELMTTFRMLLDILERVLVFSAQEVGSVASHEQTAEEARIVAGNVNTRVELTNSFIEDALYAWKKQLYDGLMGYGDKEIYAQVPTVPPLNHPELIEKIGFNIVDDQTYVTGSKMQLKGPKSALQMEGFSSAREGESRINNTEVAAAMAQVMQVMMSNQMTMMAIGPQQAIDIYNMIIRVAGMPREFKLHVANQDLINRMMSSQDPAQQQEGQQQMQQMFKELATQILNQAGEQTLQVVEKAVGPIVEQVKALGEQQQEIVDGVKQVAEVAQGAQAGVEELATRLEQILQAASQNAREQTAPVVA